MLPVVLCDLPCSIFLLFSPLVSFLSFQPFLVQPGLAHPPKGEVYLLHSPVSISLPAPQLFPLFPVPTGPSPAHSTSHCLLFFLSMSSPLPPILEVNNGENNMNQEGDVAAKSDCAWEVPPSIVSEASVWAAFIWLDQLQQQH